MYDEILLPVDGSEGASAALHHASELAHRHGGTLHLLFVADTTRDSVTLVDGTVRDSLVERGEDVLDEAAETLDTLGAAYETEVVQGTPAQTIAEHAADYDLVLMPTHGRTGVERYVLGSVTEKVVRLSPVPVLTVRLGSDEAPTYPYESLLIPTDGSEAAAYAARHGLDLADALDATVHALSVVDDSVLAGDVRSATDDAEVETAATNAVENIAMEAEARGLDAATHVEHGAPAETIRDTVDSIDVDAVAMGTTGRSGVDRILLGSVAEETVRSAPVPVITVRNDS